MSHDPHENINKEKHSHHDTHDHHANDHDHAEHDKTIEEKENSMMGDNYF